MKNQAVKILLVILSAVCLSSCKPEVDDLPQCSPNLDIYIDDLGVKKINYENSFCLCRKYHFGLDFIGPVSEVSYHPVEHCNKVIGWNPKNYSKVWMFWDDVRNYAIKRASR